jgi:hypothetical protein
MKKTMLTISCASIIAFAPVTTLAQETAEQDVGNRIVQRPDNRGDRMINDRLDPVRPVRTWVHELPATSGDANDFKKL